MMCIVYKSIEEFRQINYFNAVSEFLRVTRPGGTLAFCQQIPRPPNLIVEHLKVTSNV